MHTRPIPRYMPFQIRVCFAIFIVLSDPIHVHVHACMPDSLVSHFHMHNLPREEGAAMAKKKQNCA